MKKYSLVKKSLAVTISGVLLISLINGLKIKDETKYVKLINENGEELVVLAVVDKQNKAVVGNERLGYISDDYTFNSVTSDYELSLHPQGVANCEVYYLDYTDCVEKDLLSNENSASLESLIEFEKESKVLSKRGIIKLVSNDKELDMKKFDNEYFYSDSDIDTDLEKVIKK